MASVANIAMFDKANGDLVFHALGLIGKSREETSKL